MGAKQNKSHQPKRKSKRERRTKIAVYIMIFAMLLTTFTFGLSSFIN